MNWQQRHRDWVSGQETVFLRGEVVMLGGGEYSDRWEQGPYVVRVDFDIEALIAEYRDVISAADTLFFSTGFIPWCIQLGYITEIPNVRSYSFGLNAY